MTDIDDKWGEKVAGRGFAQIPNYLLLVNRFLEEDKRFSAVELLVLIQLVGAWWRTKEFPYPSIGTLAVRCGVSSRQAQRSVTELERRGLIRRVKRRSDGLITSNAYDLSPLVSFINEVATAFPNEFQRTSRRRIVRRLPPAAPAKAAKKTAKKAADE